MNYIYENDNAKIEKDSNGIYIIYLKEYASYDKKETEEQFQFFDKLSNLGELKVIVDYRQTNTPPDSDALSIYTKRNKPNIKTAIILKTLGTRIALKHFVSQHKIKNLALFNDLNEAKKWLLTKTDD